MQLLAVDAASKNADRYYRLMGGAGAPGKAEDAERMARAFKVCTNLMITCYLALSFCKSQILRQEYVWGLLGLVLARESVILASPCAG